MEKGKVYCKNGWDHMAIIGSLWIRYCFETL